MATKLSTSDKAHKGFAQNARRVLKLYRDNDSKLNDESGLFRQYAVLGRFLTGKEEEAV